MTDEDPPDAPFRVRQEENGLRADVFLCRRLTGISRSKAASIIRRQLARIDGEPLSKPARRVFVGECVALERRRLVEAAANDIVIPSLFEDPDILVVNKPAHVVVHRTATAYRRALLHVLRDRRHEPCLELGHRLDKETSGVLLLTKRHAASVSIARCFAEHRVEKRYLAIVVGAPDADRFAVEAPIRPAQDRITDCLMQVGGGTPARTDFRVLARSKNAALVEALPRTGRKHQIRVHLAHLGHPILGDKLYLGSESFFLQARAEDVSAASILAHVGHHRQALHASHLRLPHPTSGEDLFVEAPLPEDMVALARRFGVIPHPSEPDSPNAAP